MFRPLLATNRQSEKVQKSSEELRGERMDGVMFIKLLVSRAATYWLDSSWWIGCMFTSGRLQLVTVHKQSLKTIYYLLPVGSDNFSPLCPTPCHKHEMAHHMLIHVDCAFLEVEQEWSEIPLAWSLLFIQVTSEIFNFKLAVHICHISDSQFGACCSYRWHQWSLAWSLLFIQVTSEILFVIYKSHYHC